jgi:hypothetical protein
VRYGKVKVKIGEDAVGVIVKDLDLLPQQEQHYMEAGSDISEPVVLCFSMLTVESC